MSDAPHVAMLELVRMLLERGVLSDADVQLVAERIERVGKAAPEDDSADFEWAAHMFRLAIINQGALDPVQPRPLLGVIKGGKE